MTLQQTTLQRITIAPEQLLPGNPPQLILTPDQVHYLRQVLRLRRGDQFLALHTEGGLWRSALGTEPQEAILLEPYPDFPSLTLQATILVALPKNGFDDVVRQAVELGVKAIVPMFSERTLLQPSEQKQKRWRRIAQEAAEQCERNQVPPITPPLPFRAALSFPSPDHQRYFCVTRRGSPSFLAVLSALQAIHTPGLSSESCSKSLLESPIEIAIVTGTEGGWTDAEIEYALAQGYQSVSLGPLILRAVTAPIAALSIVMGLS